MTRGRVAIVNDTPCIVDIIKRGLEEAGVEVEVYRRGVDALEPLRANPPDVILLDQTNFPLNGMQVFARLNRWAAPPVVFVTPHAEEVKWKLGRLGTPAADYLVSVAPIAELVRRVTNLIE